MFQSVHTRLGTQSISLDYSRFPPKRFIFIRKMKATLILLVIAGAAIAQTPGGNRRSNGRGFGLFGNRVSTMFGSARDRLTNLDISNFANVQRLFNARGTARDLVLQAAANSFVVRWNKVGYPTYFLLISNA